MSEEKGKGKGKEKEEEHLVTSSPTESILPNIENSRLYPEAPLSRLASSAANLTSGLMTGRDHGQQGLDILPSGKAGSSRTTQQSGSVLRETARVIHTSSPNARSQFGTTFKSEVGQGKESSENGFSAFLGTPRSGNSEPSRSGLDQKISHVAAATMNDGSEVVDLLEIGPIVEDDDNTLYMTNEELSALRIALFSERSLTEVGWDNVLNFVPEAISNHGSDGEYQQLAQHLGVSNAAEARDIWFSQWGNVLSSYTDEVWGDLGPLVIAARQELQSISTKPEGTITNGLNAVRRLQQILAHVRGSL
ncbi:hypothetical protein GQX73_g484 [Xylaria multiplex]|uniref:Uncharacterized protein n=1 Tax=Xylaria multiplex TaxID=323545 RepID=A0A7C8N149_9PEZI|nr:hypothetical protein GQX73_g484 [Xylaria multiplex]